MLKIIEKNSLFCSLYVIGFFVVFFREWDREALADMLYFSAHRSLLTDYFFSYWTLLGEAYPYFLAGLFFYFYRKDKQTTLKIAVTGLVILVVPFILKQVFESPRPATILEEMGESATFNFVKGTTLNYGNTSFPSGHTASAFAFCSLIAFQFSQNKPIQIVLFLMAFLVGVSRVYLAQHFPQDALFGSAIGLAVAFFVEYFFSRNNVKIETPPQ